jgi:hypothetical protein
MLTAVVVVPSPSPLLPVSTPRAVARSGGSWVAGLWCWWRWRRWAWACRFRPRRRCKIVRSCKLIRTYVSKTKQKQNKKMRAVAHAVVLSLILGPFHPAGRCSQRWLWFRHHPCCSPFPPREQLLAAAAVRGLLWSWWWTLSFGGRCVIITQ